MPAPRCPICQTPLVAPMPHRPFCSARCKLVDLSKWLSEEYRVPGPAMGDGGAMGTPQESELE
ncbi:MAG: DNA gyrase inhibitor YacG [Myxococcota bacterium]